MKQLMPPTALVRSLLALLLVWFVMAPVPQSEAASKGSAAAKTNPEDDPQSGSFIDTVNVAVVNVDVFVTDKKGERIKGLTKDDFQILENGRPVAITNFSVVEAGKLFKDDPYAEPSQTPAPNGLVAAPVSEDHRLHLVVYIDNYNIQPFNRNRVMRELRDFLRSKLDREDRVMLVTYDRELHVRHSWTSDPSIVASALQDLEKMTGSAVHRESDRRDALERIEESESAQAAISYARLYAGNLMNDLNFSIDALRDMVNGLAGMPGRKAVLYVSEGLPMVAGEDLFHAAQQKFPNDSAMTEAFEFDSSRRFRELAAAANANRVTFYTIDAGGLRTMGYGDASRQTAGSGAAAGGGHFVEHIYVSNLQSPLLMLAEDTGGKAIINANRVTASLDLIAEDFDNFYSLGYQPAHFGDGRYYKIEVKVKGDKGKVRHREGYRDKAPSVQMSDGTVAALLHGFASNELGLKLDFGTQTRDDKGQFLVPIRVSIPLDKVTLLPRETSHEARLLMYVAAMDDEGGQSDVQEQEVPISIPNADLEKARAQHYLYSVSLLMRGGPHRVAVGMRDQVGATTAFVTATVRVGS